MLLVSTAADYDSIARAYGERALPKARPTPRIEGIGPVHRGHARTDPRERARLLYEMGVHATTMRPAFMGAGAARDVTRCARQQNGRLQRPRHAAAGAAAFAAQVRSEQVLINAGEL